MARNPFKERGFKTFREEEARREEVREQKRGKLYRFFLRDEDEDIEIRFLTDEPVLFYEHSINEGGKWLNVTCTRDDNCKHCLNGDKPAYKGAFLIVDSREFEVDERVNGDRTGNKIKVKDRIKILARGTRDLAKLDRLNTKYGLMSRPFYVTKVGSGSATTYEFDRGEKDTLSQKQIKEFLDTLPEKYKGMDVWEILEFNLFGADEEPTKKPERGAGKSARDEEDNDDLDEVVDIEESARKVIKKADNAVKKTNSVKKIAKKK